MMATDTQSGNLQLMKYLLSPIILPQGLWVKYKDRGLPEPAGHRHGQWRRNGYVQAEDNPPLRILVLGDSAAAGIGALHQRNALAGQLLHALKLHYDAIDWWIIAKPEATCKSTLEHLQKRPAQQFDAVITSLGVNDTKSGLSAQHFERQFESLIDLLRKKYQSQHIILSGLLPVSRFPVLPQPLRWYLGNKSTTMDSSLQKIAYVKSCEYFQLDMIDDKRLMASDGFHPGHEAYRIWGGLAAEALLNSVNNRANH